MTRKELIAEVKSDLQQYDEYNLIDTISLSRVIKNKLKRFGNNVTEKNEKVVDIRNSSGILPDDFQSLYVAYKCEPCGIDYHDEHQKSEIQTSNFYRERLEMDKKWDNTSNSYVYENCKMIKDTVYFNYKPVNFRFKNPEMLSLGEHINRSKIEENCLHYREELEQSQKHFITIKGNTLYTNFNKGYIYVIYRGLPTDEKGDLIIPETQKNYLQEYVIAEAKTKVLEDVVANSDEPNAARLLTYFSQKASDNFILAKKELKWETLPINWEGILAKEIHRDSENIYNSLPKK